jgi:hypothetical protein
VDHSQPEEAIHRDYERLVEFGLAGLEIDHQENTGPGKALLRSIAASMDLIVTGSSDYHGDKKSNQLGENLTTPENLERILLGGSGSKPVR